MPSRADALEIHEVVDGFVVYDTERDRVHYLNHTAALVLQLCDGKHDGSAIAKLIQEAFALSEPPSGEVEECLGRFGEEGLVA